MLIDSDVINDEMLEDIDPTEIPEDDLKVMLPKMTERARFRVDKAIMYGEAKIKKFQFDMARKKIKDILQNWRGVKLINLRKIESDYMRN